MTGSIITNGTNAFTSIVDKLGDIATEFIPYILYIGVGCASVWLIFEAVRYLIIYIKQKNFNAFYYRNFEGGDRENGKFRAKFRRRKRKHIKRNRIKYFR